MLRAVPDPSAFEQTLGPIEIQRLLLAIVTAIAMKVVDDVVLPSGRVGESASITRDHVSSRA